MSQELAPQQNNDLPTTQDPAPPPMQMPRTADEASWAVVQRQAKAYASSTIVPNDYRNQIGNCIIAMEMANRMHLPVMAVMQHLYVVNGRPGWSSTFLIASINESGRFTAIRYEEKSVVADRQNYAIRAWAIEKASGERLDGTWITWAMVEAEGWEKKTGSKWKTMPEQMFKYRAAGFWQRTYAPEISMGFLTKEEVEDIPATVVSTVPLPPKVVRLSNTEMLQAKSELEWQKCTIEEIQEKFPTLPADQLEELRAVKVKE